MSQPEILRYSSLKLNSEEQLFLNEALSIGDRIIEESIANSVGVCWSTYFSDAKNILRMDIQEGIYAGVSGVILFLLELYTKTGERRFLEYSVRGGEWLVNTVTKTNPLSWSFYSGRLGTAYTLARLSQISDEKSFLHQGIRIAEKFDSTFLPCDLINGKAGAMIALLHLFQLTRREAFLQMALNLQQELIKAAIPALQGIYWDRSHCSIRGLCGLSHGPSGVGFAFIEMARLTRCQSSLWLAQQAFLYESANYSKTLQNWPDYRKSFWTKQDQEIAINAYKANDKTFFTEVKDMNTWCHGAVGIALARLSGFSVLNQSFISKDLRRAIHRIELDLKNPYSSFTFCHGKAGLAEVFLESFAITSSKYYLNLARQIARDAIASKDNIGLYLSGFSGEHVEDLSLFNGTAGIGYLLLRTIFPKTVPSILLPKLNRNDHSLIKQNPISKTEVIKTFITKSFPITVSLLRRMSGKTLGKTCPSAFSNVDYKKAFIHDVKRILRDSKSDLSKKILCHLRMESQLLQMEAHHESNLLYYIESEFHRTADVILLDSTILVLSRQVKLLVLNSTSKSIKYFLLKLSHNGTETFPLTGFSYWLLRQFRRPIGYREVVSRTLRKFQLNKPEDTDRIECAISNQIMDALRATVLVAERPV